MSKKFNLEEYKKTIKSSDTPLKPDAFVEVNDALKSVMGLPGFPLGHVTQVFGLSDSGKTSLAFHAAAEAQKQGILPVFIITEGKVSWERAKRMGFDQNNAVIEYVDYLEDIFRKADRIVADVKMGRLPYNVMIFVDSIGNTVSTESVKESKDGTTELGGAMMKAAKVIREQMRVLSHRINDTRKISSPYSVGLVFINHAYRQPPAFPGAPTGLVPYGGDGIWLASSLVLRTKKGKKITTTKNGQKLSFGLISTISVDKNHLSDISNAGEFVIVPDALLPNEPDAIDAYKEANRDKWGDLSIEDEESD